MNRAATILLLASVSPAARYSLTAADENVLDSVVVYGSQGAAWIGGVTAPIAAPAWTLNWVCSCDGFDAMVFYAQPVRTTRSADSDGRSMVHIRRGASSVDYILAQLANPVHCTYRPDGTALVAYFGSDALNTAGLAVVSRSGTGVEYLFAAEGGHVRSVYTHEGSVFVANIGFPWVSPAIGGSVLKVDFNLGWFTSAAWTAVVSGVHARQLLFKCGLMYSSRRRRLVLNAWANLRHTYLNNSIHKSSRPTCVRSVQPTPHACYQAGAVSFHTRAD